MQWWTLCDASANCGKNAVAQCFCDEHAVGVRTHASPSSLVQTEGGRPASIQGCKNDWAHESQLTTPGIAMQVGFFEIVALPLFKGYVELIPAAQPMLDAIKANYQHWHEVHHVHDNIPGS